MKAKLWNTKYNTKWNTKLFEDNINTWIEKWITRKAIDKSWKRIIKVQDVKTHKEGNPTRIIISDSGTAVEILSIFGEKCLFPKVLKIGTSIQDTQHMLNILDDLNRNGNLHGNCLLVSFDVVNMFPSIDNKMGIKSVKNILLNWDGNIPPAECIIETFELCLNCNNQFLTTNILYK